MGNTDYKVNRDSLNVSTTMDNDKKRLNWSIENVYKSEVTVDSLIDTLQVIDILKWKYPNDDIVAGFEEIVREELCNLFGGTLYK